MPERKRIARGKRGFTLVELSVVLALLGILSVLTVTFLTMTGSTVNQNSADYRFLEQSDALRTALQQKISELDTSKGAFFERDGITLNIPISFDNGQLKNGDTVLLSDLTEISKIEFGNKNQDLIICTVTSANGKTQRVFAFALRSEREDTT